MNRRGLSIISGAILALGFIFFSASAVMAADLGGSGNSDVGSVMSGQPGQQYGGLIDRLSLRCRASGTCDFCDVLDGFSILTRWILGFSGAAALVMFIWFGFRFIISSGNSAIVDSAKKGLVGTVIGLVIIFGAWEIINLTLFSLTTSSANIGEGLKNPDTLKNVFLFNSNHPWNQYCAGRTRSEQGNIPGVTSN